MGRLTQKFVVTFLVVYALAGVYGAASAFWEPRGTVGLTTDYGGYVRAVVPGGPAALDGIDSGDRIVLASTPFDERRYVAGVGSAPPIGTIVKLRVLRDGATRDTTLAAVSAQLLKPERFSLLLQCGAALIFIAVGATLIWLRPSPATWGFGLYCLLDLPTADHPYPLPSAAAALAATGLYDVAQNLGVVGLVVFALDFPRPFAGLWRARARRGVPVMFGVLVAMTLYPDVVTLLLGGSARFENRVLQLVFGAVFFLALALLYDTYGRIARDERERLRWVLVGFGVGLLTNYIGNTFVFSSLIALAAPTWISNVLVSLNVLLPLTVAHAVVRNRVLDIDFVISRALAYASLTTILAALFGLLDWVFGHALEELRLSRFVQAAISIGIAFAFDTLHKRAENVVEAIFFRKRRAAEGRLARLTHELPGARSPHVVEEALVSEAVDALGLTSAGLYEKGAGDVFARVASFGWADADCKSLDDDDLLVLALRSRRQSVDLAELPWRRTDVPGGGLTPLVAVPMDSRGELTGIVLYGGHPDGSDIDPAELLLLERLAHAASVALDELHSEQLRAENETAMTTIGELRARLDELRRLAPSALDPVRRS